ncbi:MAG: sulfatase [Spirochaetes bacterium]|nr:sulfatase [Spirochaetota bacterium]
MARKRGGKDGPLTRRQFLERGRAAAGAAVLGGGVLGVLAGCGRGGGPDAPHTPRGEVRVPPGVAGTERPNIVFILTDDHRHDHFSCTGHPFLRTPNLDRIAREGVRFENAFVTTSLCSPSRASFLTGQYAHRHGVVTNHTPWNDDNVTFLEFMKASGYDTAFIGKWHMPGEGLPALRGVDRFVSFTKEGGQGVYNDCPLVIDGVETPRPGKYITQDLTDLALDFVGRERRNPFCLYLSHKAVHFGYRPPAHLAHLYDGADLHLPPESNTFIPYTNNQMFVGAPFPMDFMYRNYCRCIASVDEQVGRLLAAMEASGQLDNTVIVYAGDNGHFWGEHGLYDKREAYEESIRIPFFVRYPRLIAGPGRTAPQMALNIDLAPTLLDLLGIPVPSYMQGTSLVPVLRNPAASGRERWLYEHFPVFPIPIPGITAVRTERYKYIEYRNDVRPRELYDLAGDPREMTNLFGSAGTRSLERSMQRHLEALKRDTGYRFINHG